MTSCGGGLLGDFDGDGVTDCIQTDPSSVNVTTPYSLLFHKGVAPGQYLAAAVTTSNVAGVTRKVIDLNHDGRQDIVTCSGAPGGAITYEVLTSYGGQSDGTFLASKSVTLGAHVGALSGPASPCINVGIVGTSDFNNDGSSDLLIQDNSDYPKPLQYWRYVLTSVGGQDLQLLGGAWVTASGFVYTDGITDFDADHNLDVLTLADVSGIGHTTTATSYVMISYGLGNGLFNDVILHNASSFADNLIGASVADVNSDGKLDLVLTHLSGAKTTWYGDGARNFSTTPP